MVRLAMNGWQLLDKDSRRVRRWLLISIILHLPLTPLGPLFGLMALIARPESSPVPVEDLRGIPIELLEESPATPAAEEPEPIVVEPAPFVEVATVAPKKPERKPIEDAGEPLDVVAQVDAGRQDQLLAGRDATDRDAGALLAMVDAGADAGSALVQARPVNPDDALAASTRGIADSNANIRLSLYMDRVRGHPLGNLVGQLLKSVYQWRDFFAPASLDPVRDFDRIFVYGPQLRDSSQIAAFLQHNVRPARMRRAIDGIVKSSGSGSSWLKGTKNPAARAVADRAQRLFVVYPSHVVAVVPPGAEKDALALAELKLPAAKGEELARALVKSPWRALLGTRFQISKTIRTAEIQVFPENDGGARIEADLEDESGEDATRDARQIKRDVDAITLASNFLLSGSRLAEPLEMKFEDKHIRATLRVTRSQAERIFRIAEAYLTPEGRNESRRQSSLGQADAGSTSAPSSTFPSASSSPSNSSLPKSPPSSSAP